MKKRLVAICLILTLALSLCACEKENKYTDGTLVGGTLSGEGGARLFSPEVISLPEGMTVRHAVKVGAYIVLCAARENQEEGYKVFKLSIDNNMAEEVQGLTLESIVSVSSNNDYVANIVARTAEGAYQQYFIYPDEPSGSDYKQAQLEIPPELEEETIVSIILPPFIGSTIYETADNVYCCYDSGILAAFGPYSGNKKVLPSGEDICIISSNGEETTVQIVGQKQRSSMAAVVEKDRYKLTGSYTLCFGSNNLDEIYGWSNSDPNILYNINYQKDNKNAYANVFSSGCSLSSFIELGDSKFFAATNKGQPAIWTANKSDELKVITLATCSGEDMIVDRLLSKAVIDFNNASTDYRIDVIDYAAYNSGADPSGGYNKLNAEIAAGKAPDIYDLWSLSSVNYATKGLVEDLKPWFDADPDIDYGDLTPSVTAALEKNGCLYELVPSFSVATVFTTAERFGEAKHMSMAEFLDKADRLGAAKMFGSDMTQEDFISKLLAYAGTEYYDFDSASCNFNTPEFVRMLNFIAQLPKEEDKTTSKWENIYFGEQYLLLLGMDNMILNMAAADAVFCGEAGSIGFPATNCGGVAASADMRLAMSSSSAVQDGVWQFFKYLLSDSFQISVPSVPIMTGALGRVMEEWRKEREAVKGICLVQYKDGQITEMQVDYTPLGSNAFDRVRAIIDSVDCMDEYSMAMYTIVLQEVNAFAGGAITAEEAAANIQSKASIYISEQYG